MSTSTPLENLEKAILERAQALANSHYQAAQQQCEQILAESTKRIHSREEREMHNAKAVAEQAYRRFVQISEIKMQTELDQLRWSLVQSVMAAIHERLVQIRQQEDKYLFLLKQYLENSVQLLEGEELIVEVNSQDYALLAPRWNELTRECVPVGQRCELVMAKLPFVGGLLVHNKDNRIQVNNTFEGLVSRLESELYQTIIAQLFASAGTVKSL